MAKRLGQELAEQWPREFEHELGDKVGQVRNECVYIRVDVCVHCVRLYECCDGRPPCLNRSGNWECPCNARVTSELELAENALELYWKNNGDPQTQT